MLSEAARRDPAMLAQFRYERAENEFYPTPTKFLDCLAEHVHLVSKRVWEPCAGQGHLALRLDELTGQETFCSDLVRYPDHPERLNFAQRVMIADFLLATKAPAGVTAIITNPPYLTVKITDEEWLYLKPLAEKYGCINPKTKKVSLAELFLRHAIELMRPVNGFVAMFLRHEFDCALGRQDLFTAPFYAGKVTCLERPRWIEGSTGSPRHNYGWYCFDWRLPEGDPFALYSHPATAKPITVN
ncbi:type I restriction-modification system methyltransferase [Citromicrobium phage vB_CbaS-RXM]|nr:type I restriction-modification system methyltransferase [Citromicrobium phage vB_CbaS-RXM]